MKKLLVIANLYHASPRIPNLVTYLTDFGWETTILTVPLKIGSEEYLGFPKKFLERTKIIEASYRGDIFWAWRRFFKRIGFKTDESITEQIKESLGIHSKKSLIDLFMKWYQAIFAYPDSERSWKKPAIQTAEEILKFEHFDAILSSSPFPTSHIVAYELKKKFGICWVADFRDPWTRNHNYPYGVFRKYFEEKLELKVIRNANAITAATPAYAKKQEELHQKPTDVITNGFDHENLNNPPAPLTQSFTITYTGSIYVGKQDPEKFLLALKQLISKRIDPNDVRVRFYGPRLNWLNHMIIKYDLGDFVKQYGVISRYEAFQKQRESHILLLLNWEDSGEKGVYPGKLFEYLSAQRPILAVGGFLQDDVEKLLHETKAGTNAQSVEEIEAALLNYYEEYKLTGKVPYHPDLKEINRYSYREMANQFADLLNEMTK